MASRYCCLCKLSRALLRHAFALDMIHSRVYRSFKIIPFYAKAKPDIIVDADGSVTRPSCKLCVNRVYVGSSVHDAMDTVSGILIDFSPISSVPAAASRCS